MSLSRTNTDGERVPVKGTLGTRMQDFGQHIADEKAEIERLKKKWETTVGEIWKVGVLCLGEEVMESMLFTNKLTRDASSSPSKAESTLFVPEHGTSPPPRKTHSKKRVTFEAPEAEDELPTAASTSLDFLYQPSRLRLEPLPAVPALSDEQIGDLEEQVKELGNKEIEDYRKVERDYQAHWQKKTVQLLKVFGD